MRLTTFLLICSIGLFQGCQSTVNIKERQYGNVDFQQKVEKKALEIANITACRYKILKSEYSPPCWIVNYELKDKKEASVAMDLYGNVFVVRNLPCQQDPTEGNCRKKEISRREAIDIASKYVGDLKDVMFTYANYEVAKWKVTLILNDEDWHSNDWQNAREHIFSMTFSEDGQFNYPEWLALNKGSSEHENVEN